MTAADDVAIEETPSATAARALGCGGAAQKLASMVVAVEAEDRASSLPLLLLFPSTQSPATSLYPPPLLGESAQAGTTVPCLSPEWVPA